MKKTILIVSAISAIATACGNSSNDDIHSESNTNLPVSMIDDSSQNAKEGIIVLNAGDDMKFDKKTIRVSAGESLRLTLNHTGKMSKQAMGHNFVLLKQGVSLNDFANDAINAKDNDYIPAGTNDVIAHTKMIGGGESDVIEFKAPEEAGIYVFLCSFPGHAALMKGELIVE